MTNIERCPDCGIPYAIIGRVHRCNPPISNSEFAAEGNSAGAQAIGAHQSGMGETPPSTDAVLSDALGSYTANPGEPATISKRKPKRDRAAYMRTYRAQQRVPRTQ